MEDIHKRFILTTNLEIQFCLLIMHIMSVTSFATIFFLVYVSVLENFVTFRVEEGNYTGAVRNC